VLGNARINHACIALLHLSERWESGEFVKTKDVSRGNSLPYKYLTRILLQLRSSGLVTSLRGPGGGYRLARHPREITLWDVVRAVESADVREIKQGRAVPRQAQGVLTSIWDEASSKVKETLEKYTFEELQRVAREMYYI